MSRAKGLLKRFMHELTKEELCSVPDELQADIKQLLAQPEPEPVAWKETLIEHFQSAFDSEMYRTDEGEELILLEDAICYVEEFTPPKREPIEDGELEVWYSQHTWAMDKQEYMWGFRDAEKAHGIGGGND